MTQDEKALRYVVRKLATIDGQRDQLLTERNQLIESLVIAGGSLRAVADLAGLSHQAVKFIAHGRPTR